MNKQQLNGTEDRFSLIKPENTVRKNFVKGDNSLKTIGKFKSQLLFTLQLKALLFFTSPTTTTKLFLARFFLTGGDYVFFSITGSCFELNESFRLNKTSLTYFDCEAQNNCLLEIT